MFTRRARLLWLLLFLSDLILVAVSYEIAYLIRSRLPDLRLFYLSSGIAIVLLLTAVAAWGLLGLSLGLYRRLDDFGARPMIRATGVQTFWFGIVLAAAIYLLRLGDISRSFVAFVIVLNFILQILYRLAAREMRQFFQREFAGHRYYLVVGAGANAVELAKLIEKNEDHGDRVVAFVQESEGEEPDWTRLRRRYPLWRLGDIPAMLQQQIVDEILFAISKTTLEELKDLFLLCEEQGVKTRMLVDFFPQLRSEISLEQLGRYSMLTFSSTPENEYLLSLKRAIDLVLALVLLVLASPVMIAAAILIRLTSPGPVIYRQWRCGLNGRQFWLYKFRSMYVGSEQDQHLLAHLNEKDGPVFKIARDPRATWVGRLLRKTSLDELPQLFNILRGDMSFVGPRPPLPQEVAQYETWQRRRLRMKPGLTCLWALEGRSDLNFARWMMLDMEYIDNWSLALDFKILLRTIPRVLSGRGAS